MGMRVHILFFLKKTYTKEILKNSVLQMLKSFSFKSYIKMTLQHFLNNILNQI